jgi:hypothetical protein
MTSVILASDLGKFNSVDTALTRLESHFMSDSGVSLIRTPGGCSWGSYTFIHPTTLLLAPDR